VAVRFGHAFRGLQDVVDRDRDRLHAFALDQRAEVEPVHVLHDDVGLAGLELADVADAAHVIVGEATGGARLAHESRGGLRVLHRLRQHELDGDLLIELEVRREDDHAHPADAENALDLVFSAQRVADVRQALHDATPIE
jgi:hypothetical protein